MKTVSYKGCKIKSSPDQVRGEDPYKYAVNGVIEVTRGSCLTDIMVQNLNIPDNEWKHLVENDADIIFIKYAKQYINSH